MRGLKISKGVTVRDDESLQRYLDEVNKIPMITSDQEYEVGMLILKGEQAGIDQLVIANLRFVISVANKFSGRGLTMSDLINEGNYGLIRAANKFDVTKGFKFITFAVWEIRRAMQVALRQTNACHINNSISKDIDLILSTKSELTKVYEREPTNDEISLYLDMSSSRINEAEYVRKKPAKFDVPLSDDGQSLFDLVPAPPTYTEEDSLIVDVDRALSTLNKNEELVLRMLFGIGRDTCHWDEIVEELGLGRERCRQIRDKGLKKLRSNECKDLLIYREEL